MQCLPVRHGSVTVAARQKGVKDERPRCVGRGRRDRDDGRARHGHGRGPRGADPHVVKLGPTSDIQAALEDAGNGATIKLLPGTYDQAFKVTGDDVTIKGSGPATVMTWPATVPDRGPCTSDVIVCVTGNRDRITNLQFDLTGRMAPDAAPRSAGACRHPSPTRDPRPAPPWTG